MKKQLAEAPDVPSPRTLPWSAHNKKEISTWRSCHQKLLDDARQFRPSASNRKPRLVLFGDSITESWRGTSYGRPVPRTNGVPDVLSSTLAERFDAPLPLGIAADCTQHLLWRLHAGELSQSMRTDPHLHMVLLIGTNNLGKGHTPQEAIRGIVACAQLLLNATRGRLLVNAILPRGDSRKRGARRKGAGQGFLGDVAAVNRALVNGTARELIQRVSPDRVHFADCGADFLAPGVLMPNDESRKTAGEPWQELVRRDLMQDRLHPNKDGHRLWAACMLRAFDQVRWPTRAES